MEEDTCVAGRAWMEGEDINRSYRPDDDGAEVYARWCSTVGELWPLSQTQFGRITVDAHYREGVARLPDELEAVVGYCWSCSRTPMNQGRPEHITKGRLNDADEG